MARAIAIGTERFVLPFGALGFEMVEADAGTFPNKLRDALSESDVALVVVPESLVSEGGGADMLGIVAATEHVVLVVPDGPEPKGIGYEMVRSAITHAAGVDLLSSVEANRTGSDV